jgi:hypothetical protein
VLARIEPAVAAAVGAVDGVEGVRSPSET